MNEYLSPSLYPLLAILPSLFLGLRTAKLVAIIVPIISLLSIASLEPGTNFYFSSYGFDFTLLHVDRISQIFCYIFCLIASLAFIFSFNFISRSEITAGLFYLSSTLGVVLAGDLISFFIFWELLTLGAVPMILAGSGKNALASCQRYILFHILGGLLFLTGLILHVKSGAGIQVTQLDYRSVSGLLIFLALGINSAWPFLHTWLTDSYSRASIAGVIFLSAFTTKVAVYALLRLFPGAEPLIYIGASMAIFPIFFAVIENDLRKVLAYSLINQVGFMLVGIGIGTELAINGAIAHAFCHILYKSLLFMSVGAVIYRTGLAGANQLGGLYRFMPVTCVCCIVGAASISAFPLFSGFISKSLVMQEVANQHFTWIWIILLFAAAGVFHHAGIKVPFFAFFAHPWKGPKVSEAPVSMLIAMLVTAFLCVAIGINPSVLYDLLPFNMNYEPYTQSHVVSQLQLLVFSALAFCVLMLTRLYPAELTATNLDVDWFYRKALVRINAFIILFIEAINKIFTIVLQSLVQKVVFATTGNLPLNIARGLAAPESRSRLEQVAAASVVPVGITLLLALIMVLVLLVLVV